MNVGSGRWKIEKTGEDMEEEVRPAMKVYGLGKKLLPQGGIMLRCTQCHLTTPPGQCPI